MKESNRRARITLLGSNSGRNAGDAAILAAIMDTLTREFDGEVEFDVPTTNPAFVAKEYGDRFNVRPISVMPWTGSVRLLGIPTMRSVARSDVTLITDGIIFDINLFNPLFNFLITLIFIVPWARLWGKKVVCYNVGIGPLDSFWGQVFARWVGNACDLITVRDQDSRGLFRKIGVKKKIHLTADSVFLNWSATPERVSDIVRLAGLEKDIAAGRVLGVNVTRYVDRWLSANEKVASKEEFLPMLADTLVQLKVERDISGAIFITHIMDYDFGVTLQSLIEERYRKEKGETWKPALVSNRDYSNHELQGLMARCRLFIGMRVHSLILATRAGTPVLGLVYAPKVRSFLKELQTPDRALELARLTSRGLVASLSEAWDEAGRIRDRQQQMAKELERRAGQAATLLRERYYPHHRAEATPVMEQRTAVHG